MLHLIMFFLRWVAPLVLGLIVLWAAGPLGIFFGLVGLAGQIILRLTKKPEDEKGGKGTEPSRTRTYREGTDGKPIPGSIRVQETTPQPLPPQKHARLRQVGFGMMIGGYGLAILITLVKLSSLSSLPIGRSRAGDTTQPSSPSSAMAPTTSSPLPFNIPTYRTPAPQPPSDGFNIVVRAGERKIFPVGEKEVKVQVPYRNQFWILSREGDSWVGLPDGRKFRLTPRDEWFDERGEQVCKNPGDVCLGQLTDKGFTLQSVTDRTIQVTVIAQ